MILPQKTFFQNIKIKLNSNAWMTLKSSVVIFQALKILQLNDLSGLDGLNDLDSLISSTNPLIILVWSSIAPKWLITVPFCRINHEPLQWSMNKSSKIQFFTDIRYSFCWRLLRLASFFWKLVDERQIPTPPEATKNHNSIKLLIFLPLRADLLISVHSETPCIW